MAQERAIAFWGFFFVPATTQDDKGIDDLFRVENKTGDEAEIDIYDEISWFGESGRTVVDV